MNIKSTKTYFLSEGGVEYRVFGLYSRAGQFIDIGKYPYMPVVGL